MLLRRFMDDGGWRAETGGRPLRTAVWKTGWLVAGRLGRASAQQARTGQKGFTIWELLFAMVTAGLLVGGLVTGYVESVKQAEWSAYSLAANALALQRLEQVKSAKWDPAGGVDQVTSANFTSRWEILDVPITKTNIVWATNRTTINVISTIPPLKMVRIDCTWTFLNRGVFTNTVASYRAPDQ